MTKYLIARQISGKKIITNEGEDFGRVIDININELTGRLENLLVEPNPDNDFASKLKSDDGFIKVPYESVTAVGDYILVEKRNLTY